MTLTEDEVDLLFPSRLTFQLLKGKLKENVKVFRQQSLCSWVPDENAELRVTFDEDVLRNHRRPLAYFEQKYIRTKTVISIDTAFSTAMFADLSAICVGVIYQDRETGKYLFVVADQVYGRWRQSELAIQICEAIHKYSPESVLIERANNWEALDVEIRRTAANRRYILPYIHWKPTSTIGSSLKNKAQRIKSL